MGYRFYGWETADVRDANGLTPRDHYDLLTELWSAETCAPRMRGDWSPENRTLGQCSITAFLMQDVFGGKVFGVPLGDGNFHCYNVVGDCVFDLTSEQFGGRVLSYENNPEQFRETHFAKEEKRLRYELLRKRFKQEYAVLLKHFSRLRSGYGKVGDKSWGEARVPVPMPDVSTNRVMMGLCGTNPRDMPDRIAAMLPSLAASNLVLTVYAHNIEAPGTKHDSHNMTEADLEKILSAAKSAGVAVLGFDDLK